jgi:Cysteine-rich CWC
LGDVSAIIIWACTGDWRGRAGRLEGRIHTVLSAREGEVPDAEICPTCGSVNDCRMAKGEATCWCFAMPQVLPVSATEGRRTLLLPRVPHATDC